VYHVGLDLTPDQVKLLKVAAAEEGTTVKELSTIVMQQYLEKRSSKSGTGTGSREE
jgi:hypothetical protein